MKYPKLSLIIYCLLMMIYYYWELGPTMTSKNEISWAFSVFKDFEKKYVIHYLFQKFVILSMCKLDTLVYDKWVKSSTQGTYRGYKLDFSKDALISDVNASFQYHNLAWIVPKFITINKLLMTFQAMFVFTTFIQPAFYYGFSHKNLTKVSCGNWKFCCPSLRRLLGTEC